MEARVILASTETLLVHLLSGLYKVTDWSEVGLPLLALCSVLLLTRLTIIFYYSISPLTVSLGVSSIPLCLVISSLSERRGVGRRGRIGEGSIGKMKQKHTYKVLKNN